MAGLSIGSMQTLQVTLKHLDIFAWIGARCGPPRAGFEVKTSHDGIFNDAPALNRISHAAGSGPQRLGAT